MMELVAISIIVVAITTEVLLIILWRTNFKSYNSHLTTHPSVIILVAARNEETNIAACLDSLLALDYPIGQFQILVGDDASSDATWEIIQGHAAKYSNLNGMQITKRITDGNGKANVLAQLAEQSESDWIFITDADITVPKQWLKSMLAATEKEAVALVTGTSIVSGKGILAKIQRLDWLYATSMLKIISDVEIPATTIGNNMAIKRSVYEEIGGFESLPFSVTEDLEIFKVVKKNHKTVHLCSAEVLNKSAAQNSVMELLIQRKRWMRGAFELPIQLLSILVIQAAYFPAILILLVLNPVLGGILWISKWIIKFIFQVVTAKKLKEKVSIFDSFVSEVFTMIFSMSSLVHYLWPGKIHWKGRAY